MVEPTDKPARRAHFNEMELSEYDLTRGQKMVIDDPKTPWEDDEQSADIEMTNEQDDLDPYIENHLEEARMNREKNVQVMHDTLKQFEKENSGQNKSINIGDLLGKLNTAKEEVDKEDAAEASKYPLNN